MAVESSVAISIRASLGAVSVRPDTVHIQKEDFGQPIPIVVLSVNKSDNDEFDLVHYVHGSSRHPDYSSQRRT